MDDPGRARTLLRAWCALLVVVAVSSMVSWMIRHPLPEGWDETRYVIRMHRDAAYLHDDGVVAAAKALAVHYRSKPPAYRMTALPLSFLVAPAPLPLRLWSVVQLLVGGAFLYLTANLVAGRAAAGVALAVLLFSPTIRAVSARVYTEPPLYLAVAASFYFLARMVHGRGSERLNVTGLGVALALGSLAKLTFAVLLGPVVGLALLAAWRGWVPGLRAKPLLVASGIGVLLTAPMYVLNLGWYLAHAAASNSDRWALPASGSFDKLTGWLGLMTGTLLGPVTVTLAVIVGSVAGWQAAAGRNDLTTRMRAVVVGCLAGALPLLFLHLVGRNQHPRLASPVVVPIALMLGVLVAGDWLRVRWRALLVGALLTVQLGVMTAGVATSFGEWPVQWNWDRLRTLVQARVEGTAHLAYMGLGTELNRAQLEYPWAMRDEPVTVAQLYDSAQGPPDWRAIEAGLAGVDVIVTVPEYPKAGALDNTYNAEFAGRLRADDRFDGPMLLEFGPADDITVVHVFFRSPDR